MVVPDVNEVKESKVALRWLGAVQSQITTKQFLTDTGLTNFEIRSAFEVNIDYSDTTEDPTKYDFSWEIKSFTTAGAEIQIHFTAPETLTSSNTDPDEIEVTFWADDLFKAKNGKTVRRGLKIKAPIIR